jgi:vitamin K-dependent gamma-carboxylase
MKKLGQQIDGTSIAVFRIGFGLIMLWELIYFLRMDFVKVFLIEPKVQFSYEFLLFLKPLPKPILDILIVVLMVCCLFIIIGRFYRKAMIVFCIGFSYLFFLDKAYYNNHLYLICLLSFLLILIPADNKLSFRKNDSELKKPTQYWHLLILRLQLVIVFFFGGVAKLNYDWLVSNQPVRAILENKANHSFLGDVLTSDFTIYFFSYGGLLFDLLIPFLLFIPKTRILAVLCALLFNILNAWLFNDINIFPYFMMLSLVLFLEPNKVARFINLKLFGKQSETPISKKVINVKKPILILMAIYFLIQGLLPFRHLLYEGNVDWTGAGQRFAWRMKIQHRTLEKMEFKVLDMKKKVIIPVEVRNYGLNQDQLNLMAYDPVSIVQFAKFIKKHCRENKGIDDVQVQSEIIVSFNGRKTQPIFDKSVDLSSLGSKPSQLNQHIRKLDKAK